MEEFVMRLNLEGVSKTFIKCVINKDFENNFSLFDGVGGAALTFTNIGILSEDSVYLEAAIELFTKNREIRFNISQLQSGLWTGPFGFSLSLDLLAQKTSLSSISQDNEQIYHQMVPLLENIDPDGARFDYQRDLIYEYV